MRRFKSFLWISALSITCAGAETSGNAPSIGAKALLADAKNVFQALPAAPNAKDSPGGQARIDLGQRLFFENRASMDGNVGCFHCHLPERQATDGLPKAIGIFGKANPRNAPTIFNVSLQFKQHWRGDRDTLEEQAEKSLLGPATFGNPDYAEAMNKLKAIPGYADLFAKAFAEDKDPINQKNWGMAIAAFERTLLTPAKFDAFLGGDLNALSAQEQSGLRKFIDLGCAGCHSGPGLGGNSFQKFGVVSDYWKETGVAQPDKGRADVTKNDADLYVFKVPQLRNVAKTAPYFHDGSVAELPSAVKIMAKTQLGADLSDADTQDITAFLGALTGTIPGNYFAPTPLPDAPAKAP